MEEVSGSIPDSSTAPGLLSLRHSFEQAGFALGGYVAGEGCFCIRERRERFVTDGSPRLRFEFVIEAAVGDAPVIEALYSWLGLGRRFSRASRRRGWQPTEGLSVTSGRDLLAAVVPFCDQYLLPSAKRVQYEAWRDRLVRYLADRPTHWGRGRSTCSLPACERQVRGRGLCRVHYYEATGY